MVLAELGNKITTALRNATSRPAIDDTVIQNMLNEISTGLLAADVNIKQVSELKNRIKKKLETEMASSTNKRQLLQRVVFNELVALLNPGTPPYRPVKKKTNVIMFVGLQGSGKTTTCTKYAYYYKRKGFRVGLVCADTFRAGAFDQLKQNATKVGIPFYGDYIETDPVKLAKDGMEQFKSENFDLIIVDTSGRHKQESALFEEMEQVAAALKPDDIIFVMDSSIGQAAADQAAAFKSKVPVGSVIVTKLDGHAKGGGAISAVAATKSPITFIGTGENFDEFQEFEAQGFVSRLLGMGDIKQLMSMMADVVDEEKKPQMVERITQGKHSMRDMYSYMSMVMNMGSFSQVMNMLPGFNEKLFPKGNEGQAKLKRNMVIMDSMTAEELDHPNFSEIPNLKSRLIRLARGSGSTLQDVNELIAQYSLFRNMIGKMKDLNLQNIKSPKDLERLQKNLPQMMTKNMIGRGKKMPKGMPPNMPGMPGMDMGSMMKQVQNMMKGGGLGGLGDLTKIFGGGGGSS